MLFGVVSVVHVDIQACCCWNPAHNATAWPTVIDTHHAGTHALMIEWTTAAPCPNPLRNSSLFAWRVFLVDLCVNRDKRLQAADIDAPFRSLKRGTVIIVAGNAVLTADKADILKCGAYASHLRQRRE